MLGILANTAVNYNYGPWKAFDASKGFEAVLDSNGEIIQKIFMLV